jgi:GntR family transcriptional regulator
MTTTPKSGAGVSRYLRLYRVLSQALTEGRFVGGALPSEPRLMRDYGISRSTVRRALERLEAEDRIERKRGSGTFARDPGREAAASRDLVPLLDPTADPPAAATCRTIAYQHIPTPEFLLTADSGFGEATLLVRQVRYLVREPMALETTYLPEEIGRTLTRRRLHTDQRAILTVLATLGHHSASVEREFAALEADPLAANALGLAVGAPVFNVRTLALDLRRRTLAYVNCSYRPDRYEAHAAIEIGGRKRQRVKRRN